MYLAAGQATDVGSVGGSIEIVGGGSADTGGDVTVILGSGEVMSRNVVVASNDGTSNDASGDFLIGSGSSSGTTSSSGKGMSHCLCIFSYKSLYQL